MTRRFIHSAALALMASAVLVGNLSLPACAQAPVQEEQITWSQLTKKLEDSGYSIREIERKRDGWKAKVTDRKGERYELRLNKSGTVIREEYDD